MGERTDTERLAWLEGQTFLVEVRKNMAPSAKVELSHHAVSGGGMMGSYSSFGGSLCQAIDAAIDAEEPSE